MPSIQYRHVTGILLSLFLLSCASSAHSRHLSFVFDVSQGMGRQCSMGSGTALDIAKDKTVTRSQEELAFYPDVQISIISFSGSGSRIRATSSNSLTEVKRKLETVVIVDTEDSSAKSV